jgi:hypothetical protein
METGSDKQAKVPGGCVRRREQSGSTASTEGCKPIFIVGCPRSGTTLLRQMLDTHSRISCGPETQFLQDLARIEEQNWDRLHRFGISQEEWRSWVAAFFARLHLEYARQQGKARWADKSPNYALILDYVDTLFPTCQVIHVIRDGRDVVASYRSRWGAKAARQAPRAWRRHIEAARASRLAESQDRYLEIRYEQLVSDPRSVMRGVLVFLGEPWEDQVLEFMRPDRPGTGMDSPEQRQRALAAEGASVVYRSSVGRGRKWRDLGLRVRLQWTAGGLMRTLGYR